LTTPYRARATEHALHRDAEMRQSVHISRARLVVFLSAVACLIWTLARGADPVRLTVAAILFLVFGVLVFWHARVEERAAWHDALRTVNLRGSARNERRWDDLPAADAPASIDLVHHPYALDLDVFGRASIFQWLGPAATPRGSLRLANWLLTPAMPDAVRSRQSAVAELAGAAVWREQLAAHGILAEGARQAEIDAFLNWAEGPGLAANVTDPHRSGRHATVLFGPVYGVAVLLTVSIWILLILFALGLLDAALWLLPLLAGLIFSFGYAKRIYTEFDRAGAGQSALARYAALFAHATETPFVSPALRELHARLAVDGTSAPASMQRLNRILGFAELSSTAALLHFPIQAFTLWDFHVMFALDRWRRRAGAHVRDWMDAIGEIDALSALAAARHDNPAWCMPEIHETTLVVAEALGHPLIQNERRVTNDVQVGPPGTLLLVTGSNMSGKSTLLRAIGLNTVLAQAGGCVCAARMRLPPCDMQTSIRVQDSLELGLSYFMAALARLKGVVDAAERPRAGRTLLYLLDEILQGTNSAERGIAVRAVARHLLDAGAIGAMTTHDLNLAADEPLKSSAVLVHFTESVDEQGGMGFDYRLRDGLATSRNALRLMQMIGIDLKEP
jgi:ABC-type multidrug transport system fused ATPase/permease subunit